METVLGSLAIKNGDQLVPVVRAIEMYERLAETIFEEEKNAGPHTILKNTQGMRIRSGTPLKYDSKLCVRIFKQPHIVI